MNLYLAEVSGGGDIFINLLEEDVWDVIFNGRNSPHLETVKEKYLSDSDCNEESWEEILDAADDGSANDVVLQTLQLAKHEFYSAKDLAEFIKENPSITIVDEWSGYIY
jgi:hypothetical protein